ncbi:MAG: histidine kinase [Rhizobiales bacterium 17-65-6]|nr:MAG: histidine kinase [Azorhizobium sp. 32-67-21]OZA00834.1 MAG: histidine kinase [Rhizobiales bacterium 17-65-6]
MTHAPSSVDPLEVCAREQIHISGGIQPHGALVVVTPEEFRVVQASANCGEILGFPVDVLTPSALEALPWEEDGFCPALRQWAKSGDSQYFKTHCLRGQWVNVSAHRARQGLILEFEPAPEGAAQPDALYGALRGFLEATETGATVPELARAAATYVRHLTGFSRVLVYRFEPDWNGVVIAEDGDGTLPSYLDLRFPASDIPAQARQLYGSNRLRLIGASDYTPVPLQPVLCPTDGAPLDLSFSVLRSVSPVHLDYMRNMGTAASMSISIVIANRLWGLISCHHTAPRHPTADVRAACDFIGRIVAQQIDARERAQESEERLRLHRIETELVAQLARASTLQSGLAESAVPWLALVNADGAAVVSEGVALTAGTTPGADLILELADWLMTQKIDQIYATDALGEVWPKGREIAGVASGLLAVPISRIHPSFILWFRKELVRTVTWGGDPRTAKHADADGRLHPRRSFEQWKELVRKRALPWREAERLSATEFRASVMNFVLQRAEERAQLTDELQRSNKELEAFSYSISHDLRAPFRHIAGYAQLLAEEEPGLKPLSHHYLEGIKRAAVSAGQLVDDLLHFSQLGRAHLKMARVDMVKVMEEVRFSLDTDLEGRDIEWEIGELPPCWGDATLVRQALFNLVENAVKYTRGIEKARIRVSGTRGADEVVFTVADNGVGFDMAYCGKLFQVFQRLHRQEEYEGTGIGLALAKRIIDRHGGTILANGTVGVGASFTFTLPSQPKGKPRADA